MTISRVSRTYASTAELQMNPLHGYIALHYFNSVARLHQIINITHPQPTNTTTHAFIASTNNSLIPFNKTASSLVSLTRSSTLSTFSLSNLGLQLLTS